MVYFYSDVSRKSISKLCKEISKLEIPTGNPLLMKFNNENKVLNSEYLDSERAKDLLVY